MEINASIVFNKNYEALFNNSIRFIVNQGSSRSSKTYSLCQLLIIYAITHPNKTISIIRKTLPTLRATVMRDLFEVMNQLNLYDQRNHNKTENIYRFNNGTIIEFFSADDEQKLRGRKRDIAWVNEANELLSEDFFQLNLRTTDRIIVDYNPSDASSWIYELPEDDSLIIKSTFRDNPFLEDRIIKQIESLKDKDPELWTIYGLGERTTSRRNIFQGWEFMAERPARFEQYVMGIDFGWNHPNALVKVYYHEDEIYIEPVIYKSNQTPDQLIEMMGELEIDKTVEIVADYARPEVMQQLRVAGYWVSPSNKAVKEGINAVKCFKVFAKDDAELKKEYENYYWKKQGDILLDEPVKVLDDYMDAIRYATMQIKKIYQGGPMLFF